MGLAIVGTEVLVSFVMSVLAAGLQNLASEASGEDGL